MENFTFHQSNTGLNFCTWQLWISTSTTNIFTFICSQFISAAGAQKDVWQICIPCHAQRPEFRARIAYAWKLSLFRCGTCRRGFPPTRHIFTSAVRATLYPPHPRAPATKYRHDKNGNSGKNCGFRVRGSQNWERATEFLHCRCCKVNGPRQSAAARNLLPCAHAALSGA